MIEEILHQTFNYLNCTFKEENTRRTKNRARSILKRM